MFLGTPKSTLNFNGPNGQLGAVLQGIGGISTSGLVGSLGNRSQAFNGNPYVSLGNASPGGGAGGGGGLGGGAGPGLGSTLSNAVNSAAAGASAGLSGTSGDNAVGGDSRGGSDGGCSQPSPSGDAPTTDNEVPARFNKGVSYNAGLPVSGGGGSGSGVPTNDMTSFNLCGPSAPTKPLPKKLGTGCTSCSCKTFPGFAASIRDGISIG
jgi:hypothetical protein